MKKNAVRGYIILAMLLAVFSLLSFALPFARTTTFWLAYGFGVFAIAFQLYIFKSTFSGDGDAKSRFYGFPIARVGALYLIIQLIASMIEIALAGIISPWIALIVNVIITALAFVGYITVETMRDEIIRQDGQLRKNVNNMRELQSLSAALIGQCNDEGLKVMLTKLADEFRYSDPVSSSKTLDIETEMKNQISDIQQAIIEGDAEGTKNLCGKLSANLTERNRICSVNK